MKGLSVGQKDFNAIEGIVYIGVGLLMCAGKMVISRTNGLVRSSEGTDYLLYTLFLLFTDFVIDEIVTSIHKCSFHFLYNWVQLPWSMHHVRRLATPLVLHVPPG